MDALHNRQINAWRPQDRYALPARVAHAVVDDAPGLLRPGLGIARSGGVVQCVARLRAAGTVCYLFRQMAHRFNVVALWVNDEGIATWPRGGILSQTLLAANDRGSRALA